MRVALGLVMLSAAASCATAPPPPPPVDSFGWLSGCYASADGATRLEWTRDGAQPGVLLGKQSSWTLAQPAQPLTYRITQQGGGQLELVFADGLPNLPVGGVVSGAGTRALEFAGAPGGRRVSLRQEGTTLRITGTVTGGQASAWLFQGVPAPCPAAAAAAAPVVTTTP